MNARRIIGGSNEAELQELLKRGNITPAGRAYIQKVREGAPRSALRSDIARSSSVPLQLRTCSVPIEHALLLEQDNESGISFWSSPQFPTRSKQHQGAVENRLLDSNRSSQKDDSMTTQDV